jgi:hypothetical protein
MKEKSLSPWGKVAAVHLSGNLADVYFKEQHGYIYRLKLATDCLWIIIQYQNKDSIACRVAYSPAYDMKMDGMQEEGEGLKLNLTSLTGKYTAEIKWPDNKAAVLHYKVSFTPSTPLNIPFWPKDLYLTSSLNPEKIKGDIYISQQGARTGLIYAGIKKPVALSFLYLQNLSSLNSYFVDTETSAADSVGGNLPEIGFSLPHSSGKPLLKDKEYVIGDAFLALHPFVPDDQYEVATGYADLLARLYLHLPKPETQYHHYVDIVEKAMASLQTQGCWTYISGKPYLNAYLCDYDTPPEIMVQLSVLLPLYEYQQWKSTKDIPMAKDLQGGIASFYDNDLKTIVRWLPAAEDRLDESEEQKFKGVMDSWYLHHPRLALRGDDEARELFLTSVAYAQKVARHFKYQWPVFYKMDTLEVLKAETRPGEGGEKDVAGVYALVMLQAFEITGDKKYLEEAERAAKTLERYGFNIFYQANNTAFSAGAMIRLWKITHNERYKKLAYLHLANLFKNIALWSCEYGYGKNFPLFFGLFPLNDAPYLAVYEETEVFSAVHDFFIQAAGEDILPSFTTLLAEFNRYLIHRAVYYYPPMLPPDMLAEDIKTGELDPQLWVPLEDIHDGWEKSGAVGQEVYGAGLCYNIVPRQYIKIKDEAFLIYLDYPFSKPYYRNKRVSFEVFGSDQLHFRLMIIKQASASIPKSLRIIQGNGEQAELKVTSSGHIECRLRGGQKVAVSW